MAESVVVGVRVRPFNERERALNAELCIEMDGPTTIIRNHKCETVTPTSFTFDESFWSHDGFEDDGTGYSTAIPGRNYADQAYVFNTFGKRVLDNAWEGFHCCLFAYGQTGSGKSYSMVGYGQNKGIVPISCEEIFKRIGQNTNPNLRFEVVVSVVEIYNELIQDLLVAPEDRPKKGLDLRESKLLGIYIDGVLKRPVDSYPAIEKTIDEATENRTVGSTLMNATSSRAHTVLTIEFKQVEKVGDKDTTKVSMINLVDLAGSEKAGQTGATGDRLKEGAAINKSLSALGNVIEKLAQKSGGKKNVIIPYRESKLTRLLQNALGGSSKTIMICALSPASSNYEETLSTLRYADRAKKIKNVAVVNENPQEKLMRELREENNKLKEFMESVKDTLGEQDAAALNEKVKDIKAAEEALKEQQKSFEERLQESWDIQTQRDSRRTRASHGRSNVFGVAKDVPHMVNLNEDMLLTGRIRHKFPEGKAMLIGQPGEHAEETGSEDSEGEGSEGGEASDQEEEPDIQIVGEGVLAKHASVTNGGKQCTLSCKGKAAEATFVNGVSVAVLLKQREVEQRDQQRGAGDAGSDGEGVVLEHGDRLAFGQCLFLFVDPVHAMAEVLIMSGQVSYQMARQELAKNQWKSAGLKFMKGMRLAKAAGAKDLSTKLVRRMSSVEDGRLGLAESSALRGFMDGGGSSGTECSDTDSTELLRARDRQLEAKDREIAELRQQLAKKEAELAAARSGGAWPVEGASADAVGLPQNKDMRKEIMSTFEAAIGAIEQVETLFAARSAAARARMAASASPAT